MYWRNKTGIPKLQGHWCTWAQRQSLQVPYNRKEHEKHRRTPAFCQAHARGKASTEKIRHPKGAVTVRAGRSQTPTKVRSVPDLHRRMQPPCSGDSAIVCVGMDECAPGIKE